MAMRLRSAARPTVQHQPAVAMGKPSVFGFFTQLGHVGHVATPLCPHFSICKMVLLHKCLKVLLKNNAINQGLGGVYWFLLGYFWS